MTKFYEEMADVFEVDIEEVNPNIILEEMVWDSMAIVSTIAVIDTCFDVMIDGASLKACVTLKDIENLIEKTVEG